MTFLIKPITAQETLPIRHQVLWPNYPVERSKVDGDAQAFHFGGFLNGHLACVASLFQDGDCIRLRKFATGPKHQGQGLGTQMLKHLVNEAKVKGAKCFWFDARESALPFYGRNGFTPEGERFFKGDIPYRRITRVLD